jgi:YD repeat-containing protein
LKWSLLSFACAWAFSLSAADWSGGFPFNEAVPKEPNSRPTRPMPDPIQRYFLPGTARPLGVPSLASLLPGNLSLGGLKAALDDSGDTFHAAKAKGLLIRLLKADERDSAFLELDLRSDWEREELKGRVSRRVDFYPGGEAMQSEVLYDNLGRRLSERLFDPSGAPLFQRRYSYAGPGPVPQSLAVLDALGATHGAVTYSLNPQGLPLEEDHVNFQGLPKFHRAYAYDAAGRLVSFQETLGIKIRGSRFEWDYDAAGRLSERRIKAADPLEPVWVTQFDYADGSTSSAVAERREIFDNLPLRDGAIASGMGFDARRDLKYRWDFDDDGARLYWRPKDGASNEFFFFLKRSLGLNAGGWLEEDTRSDKNNQPAGREFWDWDGQNQLTRHEIWSAAGKVLHSESFDYDYDAQGNWIKRRAFGAPEPEERKFEYFNP